MKKRRMKRNAAAVMAVVWIAGTQPLWGSAELGGLGLNQIPGSQTEETELAAGDLTALDDLGISIAVTEYQKISQTDGFVYIYTQEPDSIPYVILGKYEMEAEDFASQFTDYMQGEYSDLQIAEEESKVKLGERTFSKIQYSYGVSGYQVEDTRLFYAENGRTWMLGAKEIPELDMDTGDTLEEAAKSMAYLAGGDSDYEQHVDADRSVIKEDRK